MTNSVSGPRIPEFPTAKQPAAAELRRRIKDLIGVSARVNVLDEGGVARSEGKAKRVIDKRKL